MADAERGKEKWRKIIFEAETPAGRVFDVIILWLIVASVAVVMSIMGEGTEPAQEIEAPGGQLHATRRPSPVLEPHDRVDDRFRLGTVAEQHDGTRRRGGAGQIDAGLVLGVLFTELPVLGK